MSERGQRRRGYHHSMEVKTRETTKTCATAPSDDDLRPVCDPKPPRRARRPPAAIPRISRDFPGAPKQAERPWHNWKSRTR